jgi:adenylate cyclase class IV
MPNLVNSAKLNHFYHNRHLHISVNFLMLVDQRAQFPEAGLETQETENRPNRSSSTMETYSELGIGWMLRRSYLDNWAQGHRG